MSVASRPLRTQVCCGRGNSLAWLLAVLVGACLSSTLARAADPRKASTTRESREEALAALPLAQIAPADQAAMKDILEDPSIYRRMPAQVIDCDPHFYMFLMDNPEVIVEIWHVLGISKVQLDRTGPDTFKGSDGEGTVCNVRVLHRAHDRQVLYATGAYEGSVLSGRVEARCVLMFRSAYIRETNGRHYVTCVLDAFVKVDRGGVEILAKTFQSLIGRSADMNFAEAMGFVSSLSRTAEVNPDGVARVALKLPKVEEETRNRLAVLSAEVAARAETRDDELRAVQHQEAIRREPTPSIPRR